MTRYPLLTGIAATLATAWLMGLLGAWIVGR